MLHKIVIRWLHNSPKKHKTHTYVLLRARRVLALRIERAYPCRELEHDANDEQQEIDATMNVEMVRLCGVVLK
jgi:hypothetical protein